VEDLREVLEEGSAADRKAFIKSFVKDIEVTGGDEMSLAADNHQRFKNLPRGSVCCT